MQRKIQNLSKVIAATPQRAFFNSTMKGSTRLTSGVHNFGIFVIVGEKFATLVHRFEKYDRQMKPGFNFIIPVIEKIAYVHDMREQVIEISTQVAVTKDNVALHIDGVLYIQIVDPEKASYGVENYETAISNLAQTTMRSEIGRLTLDSLFQEREQLNLNIIKNIQKDAAEWGISALRYEIKDIEPPSNIQKSMILQAEAERRKRADILSSEGEKIANINVAEAEKQSQILKAEGHAEGLIVQAKAQAEAFSSIEEQLQSPEGRLAAQFLIGQRKIAAFKQTAKKQNTFIVNSTVNDVSNQVHECLNILTTDRK